MGSMPAEPPKPWIETPCIPSKALSRAAGCNILLKLDNLQPAGSFKQRGIGNLVAHSANNTASPPHFYCSSGGNAGLACATAAAALARPATIVVPLSTKPVMVSRLRELGATVHQAGASWADADLVLREEHLARDPAGVYVPPFDNPVIWAGVSSLVDELSLQLDENLSLHGIVCSVGGGGLLNGIMQGVDRWRPHAVKPRVVAVETRGADSLNASVRAGELVTLPGITSIASSLGAVRVCDRTWEYARAGGKGLSSVVVSDAEAAMACVRFADDHRFLVEPGCGATLAVAYYGHLRRALGAEGLSDEEWARMNVVLEVCGGSAVTLEILEGYRAQYASEVSS